MKVKLDAEGMSEGLSSRFNSGNFQRNFLWFDQEWVCMSFFKRFCLVKYMFNELLRGIGLFIFLMVSFSHSQCILFLFILIICIIGWYLFFLVCM
jgi:hypothetical protein